MKFSYSAGVSKVLLITMNVDSIFVLHDFIRENENRAKSYRF